MPERRVRHAFVSYTADDGDHVMIFRGDVHDFPQAVIDRVEPLGAFMDSVDQEPAPQGVLLPDIDKDSSDETVLAWLTSATLGEAAEFFRNVEDSGDEEFMGRLTAMMERLVDNRRSARETRADAIRREAQALSIDANGATTVNGATDAVAGAVDPGTATSPGPAAHDPGAVTATDRGEHNPLEDDLDNDLDGGAQGTIDFDNPDLDLDSIIGSSIPVLSVYLAQHPERAADLLAAENRRVEAAGENEPRKGVVRLVETAAGRGD